MNGVLIIDKPAGLTSHDVVNRVRRILQQPSVGHLGTLDPLATGVLPLVTGNLTRLAQFYTSSEKTYEGTIRFGFATDTYDSDGEAEAVRRKQLKYHLNNCGNLASVLWASIEQMPPPFSAKKIKGVPAYKLARKHKDVPLKPVQVEIKEFEILASMAIRRVFAPAWRRGPTCAPSPTTWASRIGCGAHLASLRRTVLGEFNLSEAHTLEELSAAVEAAAEIEEMFIHPRRLLPQFPCVTASDEQRR